MLVIISDLHLTDGESSETIKPGAFEIFREEVGDMAEEASWRKPKYDNAPLTYEPISDLHIVLLGDILDVIRSPLWLKGSIRPWSDRNDPAFALKVEEITNAILAGPTNRRSLAGLRSLSLNPPWIRIPESGPGAEGNSQPSHPVKAHIHYMVGNHDWFFHLAGPAYDRIRASICDAMGLENHPGDIFPYDPSESPVLQQVLHEHNVFARHGDKYDVENFDDVRNASSLGDAIVVELLDRFPEEVNKRMGNSLPPECLLGLREIDNVRPLEMVPVWLDGLLRNTCTPDQCRFVKEIWNEVADEFLRLDFVKQHHSLMKWGLKLSRGFSMAQLSQLIPWGKEKLSTLGFLHSDFYPNAGKEKEFNDLSARFIVFGHTHRYEIVPLRSTACTGGRADQMYFNSGTWRVVHEPTKITPPRDEFVAYHVMSYLAFFKEDERKGHAFETWSGAMDTSAA